MPYDEETPSKKLEQLLRKYCETRHARGDPPLLTNFLQTFPGAAALINTLKKNDMESSTSALNRVFKRQFKIGLHNDCQGKRFTGYIKVCGHEESSSSEPQQPESSSSEPQQPSVVKLKMPDSAAFCPKYDTGCKFGAKCRHRQGKATTTDTDFDDQTVLIAKALLAYLLSNAGMQPGGKFQILFSELNEDKNFLTAINQPEMTESALMKLIFEVGLVFTPSTGMITLPESP